jgi:hypothetical protein
MDAWKQVQVNNETHLRHQQAGVVEGAALADGSIPVKFDLDGVTEYIQAADLKAL